MHLADRMKIWSKQQKNVQQELFIQACRLILPEKILKNGSREEKSLIKGSNGHLSSNYEF